MLRKKAILLGIIVVFMSPVLVFGVDETWEVGVEPSFTSGDYGTGTDTDITYVPVTIRRSFGDGDLSLIIPYIHIESTQNVTIVGGSPNRIKKARGGGGGVVGTSVTTRRTTEEGLGDLILQGRYYVLAETEVLPLIGLIGRIKFPTADEDKGLGTGELDVGFGLELSKSFSEEWEGYFDVGYTFIGDPSGLDLRDQWYYSLGLGHCLTMDLLVSAYYEEWRALVAGEPNPRDLFFTVNYNFSQEVEFTAGLILGLSDGAPDYGVTGGIRVRF